MPELFNKALLLGKLKRKLGLFYLKLPIEDKDLLTIIDEDTIPTYSIYFPQELRVDITEADKVPGSKNTFFIDEKHIGDGVNIVDIELIYGTYDPVTTGMFYPLNPTDVINLQMSLDLTSAIGEPIAYNYIPPNKIEVLGGKALLGSFSADLLLTHNKKLTSIRPSQIDSFTKLALLDIKAFLYENLKHFDQIETTFGTINLRIDNWSNAENEKEELLNVWDEKYLANRKRTIYTF